MAAKIIHVTDARLYKNEIVFHEVFCARSCFGIPAYEFRAFRILNCSNLSNRAY